MSVSDSDCNRDLGKPAGAGSAATGLADSQKMNAKPTMADRKTCADLSMFFLRKHVGCAEAFADQVLFSDLAEILGGHFLELGDLLIEQLP